MSEKQARVFSDDVDLRVALQRWARLRASESKAATLVLFYLDRLSAYTPQENPIMHLYYMQALESDVRRDPAALPNHIYEKGQHALQKGWRLREKLGLDNYVAFDSTQIAPHLAHDAIYLQEFEAHLAEKLEDDDE